MKKKILLGLFAIGCLTMSGCSMSFEKDGIHINDQKNATSKQLPRKEKQKNKKNKNLKHKSQKNINNKKDKKIWSVSQDKELEKFMIHWGKSMGQKYKKYSTKAIKTSSGTIYPSVLDKRRFLLDKKVIKIGWNPDGKKKLDYNVVAIYNNNLKTHGMHSTYLFTIKDKKGIVLIDEGKNVNPLILHQSKNSRLNKDFNKIIVKK